MDQNLKNSFLTHQAKENKIITYGEIWVKTLF